MATVTIRCPETGRAVSTGIETEPEEFRRLPPVASRLSCPACGKEHVWSVTDAFLDPADDEAETRSQTQAAE